MWLTKQYYDMKKAPTSDGMIQTLGVMEMKAAFEGMNIVCSYE